MTGPFPQLRTLALIEGAEAVADNITNAVTFEIARVVGTTDPVLGAVAGTEECEFDLGDGTLNNAIERLMAAMCVIMRRLIGFVGDLVEQIFRRVADTLEAVVETVAAKLNDFAVALTTRMGDIVDAIVERVGALVDTIVTTLQTVVDAITAKVADLVDGLRDVIGAIFDQIGTVVDTIINKISDGVSALISGIGAVLERIRDGFTALISTVVDSVWAVITRIGDSIGVLIDTLVGTAETGLGRVRDVIESIPATLRELAESAQTFIGERIGDPLSNLGSVFITQVESFFERLIDDTNTSPDKVIEEFLTGVGVPAEVVSKYAQSANAAMPRTPIMFAAAMAILVPFLLAPIVSRVISPVLDELSQEVAQLVTPTLIPPTDAIDLFVRGVIDEAKLDKEMGEAGYSRERIDLLLTGARRLLGAGDYVTMWLRDIISEDQFDRLLGMQRITSQDQERIKDAAFFIPPVQDLIRMAVREVFDPSIREQFQLDANFPSAFERPAKQQGVSAEWARNYWAAHWVLPNVTQAFSMLHRRVIDANDLDLLLRAQDVMPFWRDKLTQIAFHPLTRVDLRRMHKLGVLDSAELQIRYEALGFAPDDAALMVQFTEAFNSESPADVAVELEGLTRSTILSMMDDGILSEPDAQAALIDLGISDAAARLFITQRRLESERRGRAETVANTVRLAKGGHITLAEAQDTLGRLGLTATEIALATQRIIDDRGVRDKLPTMAQLNKMLAADIIAVEQWREAVGGLGFSDAWTDRLLLLEGGIAT